MTQPGEDLHQLDAPLPDGAAGGPEAPAEDVYEQALPAGPATTVPADLRLPFDANEADVYEQDQVVELDDEY